MEFSLDIKENYKCFPSVQAIEVSNSLSKLPCDRKVVILSEHLTEY